MTGEAARGRESSPWHTEATRLVATDRMECGTGDESVVALTWGRDSPGRRGPPAFGAVGDTGKAGRRTQAEESCRCPELGLLSSESSEDRHCAAEIHNGLVRLEAHMSAGAIGQGRVIALDPRGGSDASDPISRPGSSFSRPSDRPRSSVLPAPRSAPVPP